jgi:hypothetical protein
VVGKGGTSDALIEQSVQRLVESSIKKKFLSTIQTGLCRQSHLMISIEYHSEGWISTKTVICLPSGRMLVSREEENQPSHTCTFPPEIVSRV